MRFRVLASGMTLAAVASMATSVQASAQTLQAPFTFSPPPEQSGFTLTSQPLFAAADPPTRTGQQASGGGGAAGPDFGFGFGVKLGPSFTSFNQSNADFSRSNGFVGGVFFGGNRSGILGVQAELLYVKKTVSQTSPQSVDTDLYYFEIPVVLRVNIGSKSVNKFAVYGVGGPSFNIKLKGKLNDLDVSNAYESFAVDVLGGIGVEITRFIIEARATWALRDVLKIDLNAVPLKDRAFVLLFGVRIS